MDHRRALGWLVALSGVELLALTTLALDADFTIPELLVAYSIAFAAYGGLLLVIARAAPPVWLVVAAGLFLRIPWLPTAPTLSDDVWRYLHDGRAQVAGVNPYRYAPVAPEALEYAGPEHDLINHPELTTVYPPAAQVTFFAAAVIGPSLFAWKGILLIFELLLAAGIVLLLRARGKPRGRVAVYLLHPLPIIEFAGNGHVDAVAIATLVLALGLLAERRRIASGIALAFSIAAKYLAAPVALFGARDLPRNERAGFLIAGAAALLLLYAPYLDASPFGSLRTFAETFEFNGSVYALATTITAPRTARFLLAAGLAGLLGLLWWRRADTERAAFVWIAGVLLVSPIVHPWYVVWLIPFLAWRWEPWVLAWTATVVLSYTVLPAWHADGVWQLPAWVPWVEYAPVMGLLVWQMVSGGLRSRARGEPVF